MKEKNLVSLSFQLNKLILKKGKLSKISFILDKVFLLLVKSLKINPLVILNQAIDNVAPLFLLKNRRIGKKVLISPSFILSDAARKSLGIKWIVEAAFKQKKESFCENFFSEILEAFNNKGLAKKKQKDLHLMVLDNKSNFKYRW